MSTISQGVQDHHIINRTEFIVPMAVILDKRTIEKSRNLRVKTTYNQTLVLTYVFS